jgi:hypothetical protein
MTVALDAYQNPTERSYPKIVEGEVPKHLLVVYPRGYPFLDPETKRLCPLCEPPCDRSVPECVVLRLNQRVLLESREKGRLVICRYIRYAVGDNIHQSGRIVASAFTHQHSIPMHGLVDKSPDVELSRLIEEHSQSRRPGSAAFAILTNAGTVSGRRSDSGTSLHRLRRGIGGGLSSGLSGFTRHKRVTTGFPSSVFKLA